MSTVANINKLPFEKRILYFDEEHHKYSDDRGMVYTSTTTLIHTVTPPFDSKNIARRIAKTKKVGIYANKTAKQIEKQWSDVGANSGKLGSEKHDYIENNVNAASKFNEAIKHITIHPFGEKDKARLYTVDDVLDLSVKYKFDLDSFKRNIEPKYPIIYKTIEWYINLGFEAYAEIGIYDPNTLVSGMIDLLLINRKTRKFIIIDWKTCRDEILFVPGYYSKDEYGQTTNNFISSKRTMKHPLDNLYDSKGMHYTLQLSIYAYMMQLRGYTCDDLILFHIRDHYKPNKYGKPYTSNDGMYVILDKPEYTTHYLIQYLYDDVTKLFKYHKDTNVKSENFKLNF